MWRLQEVQRDHFEANLQPDLADLGYGAVYKKRTAETEWTLECKERTVETCDRSLVKTYGYNNILKVFWRHLWLRIGFKFQLMIPRVHAT